MLPAGPAAYKILLDKCNGDSAAMALKVAELVLKAKKGDSHQAALEAGHTKITLTIM